MRPAETLDRLDVRSSASVRRWCLAGVAASACFAAYISLVPFNFTGLASGASLADALTGRIEVGIYSRGNFLANILLFVPIGFLGVGAVVGLRIGALRAVVLGVLVLTAAAALSVSIETLQVFTPRRTPSWADVTAHGIGTAAGIVAWLALAGTISRWVMSSRAGETRGMFQTAVSIYAFGRVFAMLMPLDITVDLGMLAEKFRRGQIILNPLHSPALGPDWLPTALSDLILAVPLGIFTSVAALRSTARRPVLVAMALGVLLVGLVETAQIFVMSRAVDTVDFLVNALGVTIGALLIRTFSAEREVGRIDLRGRLVPVTALLASTVVYVAYNWNPFDFQVSADLVRTRVPRLWAVPFHAYYVNPEFKALDDILVKTALGLPVGLFFQRLIGSDRMRFPGLAVFAALTVSAIFFAVVEAGQILLPSRYPDNTDVLLALGGAVVGWQLARLMGRSLRG